MKDENHNEGGDDIVANRTTLMGTPVSRGEQLGLLNNVEMVLLNQDFNAHLTSVMAEWQGAPRVYRQVTLALCKATLLRYNIRDMLMLENNAYFACRAALRSLFDLTMYLAYLSQNLYSSKKLKNNSDTRRVGRDYLQFLLDEEHGDGGQLGRAYGDYSQEVHGEDLWVARDKILMSVEDGTAIATRFFWTKEEILHIVRDETSFASYLNTLMFEIAKKMATETEEGRP